MWEKWKGKGKWAKGRDAFKTGQQIKAKNKKTKTKSKSKQNKAKTKKTIIKKNEKGLEVS